MRKKNTTKTKMNNPERNIISLVGEIKNLARVAARQYAVEVVSIVNEKTRDVARIERCLDGLLDFCFDDEALALYKNLCRYYFDIDPAATASYVNAYREMWDSPLPEKG
ncbi:MAG: hypothetical protein AB1724_01510 [Thermodesulfobacteriota bacterium]